MSNTSFTLDKRRIVVATDSDFISSIKKFVINIFLIPFYSFFSYVVPKNKKLVLLGACLGGKFLGNTKYFYLFLEKKDKCSVNFFWVTKSWSIYDNFKKEGRPVLFAFFPKGIWHILRANYLLVEQSAKDISGTTILLGKFNIINFWHGVPIKKILFDNNRRKGFADFLVGSETKNYKAVVIKTSKKEDKLAKAFRNENILVLGSPRDDMLIKGISLLRGKSRYAKRISYIPTYRNYIGDLIPFSDSFLDKLEDYLEENNYIFFIQEHPLMPDDRLRIKGVKRVRTRTHECEDVQELLLQTDILITDYSSVAMDFCLTKKPIIFYPYDYEEYLKYSRDLYYDYYKIMPGPFANTDHQLLTLIKEVDSWFKKRDYQKKYTAFKNRFNHFEDGKSSERVYTHLDSLTS